MNTRRECVPTLVPPGTDGPDTAIAGATGRKSSCNFPIIAVHFSLCQRWQKRFKHHENKPFRCTAMGESPLEHREHRAVAFRAHRADTVATLLDDVEPGPVVLIDSDGGTMSKIVATETIFRGHKIALADLDAGEPVVKYGIIIGTASRDVSAGAWVHLHNCASGFDERSTTLDVITGAPSDTHYG